MQSFLSFLMLLIVLTCFFLACQAGEVVPAIIMDFEVNLFYYFCEFVDDLRPLAMTCKHFWNVITWLLLLRVYQHRPLSYNNDPFMLAKTQVLVGSPLTSLLAAFGVPKLTLDIDFVAENLSIFLQSPAFRRVFLQSYWPRLRHNPVLLQQSEQLEMFQNDLPHTVLRRFDSKLIKNVATRLHILASLPLNVAEITSFLEQTSFPLLIGESEETFNHLLERIGQRIVLLPISSLLQRFLHLFSFDYRLVNILVRTLIENRRFSELHMLLRFVLPANYRLTGHIYVGCVTYDSLADAVESYLNTLDSSLAVSVIETLSSISTRYKIYLKPRECEKASFQLKFHALLLHRDWRSLRKLFSDKEAVEVDASFNFLRTMDSSLVLQAIRECPQIARLHTLLLDCRYQGIHFDSFTSLQSLRDAMKEEVSYPEVLAAYFNYFESRKPRIYHQLLNNSASRINDYFAMKLNSVERKRYKSHPSFIIAIASLDGILERKLAEAREHFEYCDKERILKAFLDKMGIMPGDLNDYFELAHTFPSFRQAMIPAPALGPESQLIRSETDELSAAASFFNIHRVINDGGRIRYDLIIRLMKQFKSSLTAGIIPVELLRQFVKSAAFFMTQTRDSKHIPFKMTSETDPRRAILIYTIQGAGQKAAIKKHLKNRFPGTEFPSDLLNAAISFYMKYLHNSRYLPTNSENETFVIDLSKCFLQTRALGSLEDSISWVLSFFGIRPEKDPLLVPQLRILISIAYFELQ